MSCPPLQWLITWFRRDSEVLIVFIASGSDVLIIVKARGRYKFGERVRIAMLTTWSRFVYHWLSLSPVRLFVLLLSKGLDRFLCTAQRCGLARHFRPVCTVCINFLK